MEQDIFEDFLKNYDENKSSALNDSSYSNFLRIDLKKSDPNLEKINRPIIINRDCCRGCYR